MANGELRSDIHTSDQLAEIWQLVMERIEPEIGQECVDQWIKPARLTQMSEQVAVVSTPSSFLADWVDRNFARQLLRHLQKVSPGVRRIQMIVSGQGEPVGLADIPDAEPVRKPREVFSPGPAHRRTAYSKAPSGGAQQMATDQPGPLEVQTSAALDAKFTFDSFVVGKPNELAHAAARRVAETADASFNPVFLYGGVGRGKTHLMHAIGHQVAQTFPGRNVLYLSAEQFMYRFIQALRSRDMLTFKQQFRAVDVLMIDDVQFIAGKDSTQEEFFHTFNALVDQQKQIVISADQSPEKIDGLENRIKSRLQQGLVVDIHPADYELRLGILQQKVEQMCATYTEVDIDPKVLEFLAHRISTNVRVLEGALIRLFAFASLVNRRIDMEVTQECLADLLRTVERKVTIEEIKRVVSTYYNLRMSDLTSARRARNVARPRQMAMYLCKMLTPKSLPEIGRGFGNRDHTTVIHAVKTIEKLKESDGQLAEDLEALRRSLEGN